MSEARQTTSKSLSPREQQVAALLDAGKSPTQISRELSISVKSACSYRSRILEKRKGSLADADQQNEARVNSLLDDLTATVDSDERRRIWGEMVAAIGARSPEQIQSMEASRGLA